MHWFNREFKEWFLRAALMLIALTAVCAITTMGIPMTKQYHQARTAVEYQLIGGVSVLISLVMHWNASTAFAVLGSNLGMVIAWCGMVLLVPWLDLGDEHVTLIVLCCVIPVAWLLLGARRAYLSIIMRVRV